MRKRLIILLIVLVALAGILVYSFSPKHEKYLKYTKTLFMKCPYGHRTFGVIPVVRFNNYMININNMSSRDSIMLNAIEKHDIWVQSIYGPDDGSLFTIICRTCGYHFQDQDRLPYWERFSSDQKSFSISLDSCINQFPIYTCLPGQKPHYYQVMRGDTVLREGLAYESLLGFSSFKENLYELLPKTKYITSNESCPEENCFSFTFIQNHKTYSVELRGSKFCSFKLWWPPNPRIKLTE